MHTLTMILAGLALLGVFTLLGRLIGSAIYKKVVYGTVPLSHVAGVVVLAALIPVAFTVDLLTMGWLTTIVMLAIGIWDGQSKRRRQSAAA
ncbi:hypothetical protein [Mesorhizobium sp. J428]|uniref:hypothetical protein n=1 Tax=Mesorhizobium sp. J428 TaxID=2898440 RepID=UPI0021511B63|nr:hypothetical protein [Mesorhizobium sp. J428]MCR5857321.1 hypothetical protein [Mesorhizobium sp. J428]